MEKTQSSQAKPLTTWCLLVFALVAIFVVIGAALFFTPGHGQPDGRQLELPGDDKQNSRSNDN